tara:strand:+ start:14809 stop:16749 length:1941 start_codon:yes stop_codon:yes gene_type:complete
MASKDFIVKNGLRIGGSSGTGGLTASNASFLTSLSAAGICGAAGTGFATGATIALAGDVTGSVDLDTLGGTKTITATIAADSVALGTDTTGSYVQSFGVNTTYQTLTGTIGTGEGADVTGLGLSATGVHAGSYGSSTAIPTITVLSDGRISSINTAAISTDLTIAADSGSNDTVSIGTDTLTFAGTSNEIETTVSDNQIQIGLPNNVTLGGDLRLNGNSINDSSDTTAIQFDGSGNTEICGNLTVQGTHTTLNTSVTSTTTATENNFVITSTDTGADAAPDLKLYRNSSSPADNDRIGNIIFTGRNDNTQDVDYGQIVTRITDASDSSEDAYLTFKTMAAGTLSDRLTINSGLVGIGTTAPGHTLSVAGTISASGVIYGDAFNSASGGSTIDFKDDVLQHGALSVTGAISGNSSLTINGDSTLGNASGDTITLNGATINIPNVAAGTDNTVVIYNGSTLLTDEIDSRVWGSTLIDGTGNANRIAKFTDGDTIADSSITDDGNAIIIGTSTGTTANAFSVSATATAGSIQFNNNRTAYHSVSSTIANSASGTLIRIPKADYRTSKIVISAKGTSACTCHAEATELLIVHDGANAAFSTEFAIVRTGDQVGTYCAEVIGGDVELRATNELGGSATATFVASVHHLGEL